jgi:hypothetical protein
MKRSRSRIVDASDVDGLANETAEIKVEEMREFMMGDLLPDLANPDFKARLRAQMWEMLQRRRSKAEDKS